VDRVCGIAGCVLLQVVRYDKTYAWPCADNGSNSDEILSEPSHAPEHAIRALSNGCLTGACPVMAIVRPQTRGHHAARQRGAVFATRT
jgi:hypothetical protein